MTTKLGDRALVVLSGGQDSTTCLLWALEQFNSVTALCFNYGQRHAVEIESAQAIAEKLAVPLTVYDLGAILTGSSPLVNKDNDVEQYESAEVLPGGIENTFVPSRNAVFLTIAANLAAANGINDIVTGVCQEDSGGYPDCRIEFIDAMSRTLSLGILGSTSGFRIHTPLMYADKAGTVNLALRLKNPERALEALALSHTCYNGETPPCGKCHACLLRSRGFSLAGIPDPLIERCEGIRDASGALITEAKPKKKKKEQKADVEAQDEGEVL